MIPAAVPPPDDDIDTPSEEGVIDDPGDGADQLAPAADVGVGPRRNLSRERKPPTHLGDYDVSWVICWQPLTALRKGDVA